MSLDAVIDLMQECIDTAKKALAEITPGEAHQSHDDAGQLHWLEKQLSARIVQIQGLMLDLEAGLSFSNLGFLGEQDIAEMLEDVEAEIRQLQRMIREIKSRSRLL